MQANNGALLYFYSVILVLVLVFGNLFFVKNTAERTTASKTYWGFPVPFLGDYLTNIYRIKLGQEGTLLYQNYYTNETTPSVLFEPHYNIVGMLTKPVGIDPFPAYELFRFAAIAGFVSSVAWIIAAVFPSFIGRITALVTFLFSTSIWKWDKTTTPWAAIDPQTYSDYFNVFTKITNIKAHHLLALSCVMGIFFVVTREKMIRRHWGALIAFSVALGFLHPYIAMYTGIFLGVYAVFVRTRIRAVGVALAILIPVVVYHGYVLGHIWKASMDVAGTLTWAPRGFSLETYLFALGFQFFIGLGSFFIWKTYRSKLLFVLLIWGYLPVLLFFLPDLGIPWGPYRMFQMYQLIPLSILSTHCLLVLFKKIHLPLWLGSGGVIVAVSLYASVPYRQAFTAHTNPASFYFYYQMVYEQSAPLMKILREKTPEGSVVLASEITSQFIPIEAHNKVVIAHPGTNPNFEEKLSLGNEIMLGRIAVQDLSAVLTRLHVDYIVFGFDRNSVPFDQTPYTALPFLTEVYKKDQMSLVAVDRTVMGL